MEYPDLHLVSHKLCPHMHLARIVLAEKTIPHRIEFIDLVAEPDSLLEISPLGRLPVLHVDGRPLVGSSSIAEYLDDISPGSLHPHEMFARAHNRSWIEFAAETLAAIAVFCKAKGAHDLSRASRSLQERFSMVEDALGKGPWFNGEVFSLVDAAFGPVFRYFEVIEMFGRFGLFAHLDRVEAWRNALASRESVRMAVVGDYNDRLRAFFLGLDSELGQLVEAADFPTDSPTIN